MLNKNIVHLIDDIFWNMGFTTQTQADKVMPIILYALYRFYNVYALFAGSSGS